MPFGGTTAPRPVWPWRSGGPAAAGCPDPRTGAPSVPWPSMRPSGPAASRRMLGRPPRGAVTSGSGLPSAFPCGPAVQRVLADGLHLCRGKSGWLGGGCKAPCMSRMMTRDQPQAPKRRWPVRPCGQTTGAPRRALPSAASRPSQGALGPVRLPGRGHRRRLGQARRCGWCTAAGARRSPPILVPRPPLRDGVCRRHDRPTRRCAGRGPGATWSASLRVQDVGWAVSSPSHHDDRRPLARADPMIHGGIMGVFWKAAYGCGPRCTLPVHHLHPVG